MSTLIYVVCSTNAFKERRRGGRRRGFHRCGDGGGGINKKVSGDESRISERKRERECVCVRVNRLYRHVFTLLLVRDLFLIFNYYEFKLLIVFLLVDELSLYNITDL